MNTPKENQVEALLLDLKLLYEKHEKVTRDLYRTEGAFPERTWKKFYPTFGAFVNDALWSVKPEKAEKHEEETNSFVGDTWSISIPETDIHTLPQLLEYCQVDLSTWEVERFVVNKWSMGAKNAAKEIVKTPLYQVKATLVKRKEIVDARAELEKIKEDYKKDLLKDFSGVWVHPFSGNKTSGNLLEINIPDLHAGKLAWGEETDAGNYDTQIAILTFERALNTLLERASGYVFDKIVLVVGNDLLQSDDEQGRTTKGTFVSTDGRYQKTFRKVRKMVTDAIEQLRLVAPVEVVMVSGNHDSLGVWHLGDSLECYFVGCNDVTVRNEPTQRKYIRHGNVLLMFTHGDKGKVQDYPLLIATERPKDFGETLFREVHTGHIHQTKLQEWHGVRVRILPSLSQPDAWHSENGFTGQQRNAEAYVWNSKHGLIAQFYYNDDSADPIDTTYITGVQ